MTHCITLPAVSIIQENASRHEVVGEAKQHEQHRDLEIQYFHWLISLTDVDSVCLVNVCSLIVCVSVCVGKGTLELEEL